MPIAAAALTLPLPAKAQDFDATRALPREPAEPIEPGAPS
jgi:hypothetical protein